MREVCLDSCIHGRGKMKMWHLARRHLYGSAISAKHESIITLETSVVDSTGISSQCQEMA